jgi:hypothetical protein
MKNLKKYEQATQIADYPDYWITSHGRVWSTKGSGRWLKPTTQKEGYQLADLWKNGKHKTFRIHRLVAEAFLENPNGYRCVLHGDGDPANNHVENLRYGTRKMNYADAVKHGTLGPGEKHPSSKLTANQVREIKLLLRDSGQTQRKIAEKFGVSRETITCINTGYTWSHIKI